MTMAKNELNSIWARVREDRDVDDLIFRRDAGSGREDERVCSDR